MKNKPAHSSQSGNARARRRDLRQAATGLATASVLAVGLPATTALAGTGSCVGSGAITVADARVGECQLQTGDSLSVTGTGSITGDGGSTVVGVRVEAGNTGIQIINDGDIIGNPSDGLWNAGTITEVTNRGRIGAGPFALGVYSTGTINVLNNEAGAEIQAGTGSINAIESYGTLGTLNNAGHILGGIRTGNTTLNLSGSAARITGPVNVVGTNGSVNVVSGAVFTTENTFRSNVFRIQSGARLVIGSSFHVIQAFSLTSDAFSNAGTLHVPEGVHAQITGHYTQSGALRLGVSSSSSFGRLTVSGDVNLQPSATFVMDVNGTNTLAAGDTLEGVLTAGGTLTNAASATNVSDNSALFNFRSQTSGNQVNLLVDAAGAPPPPAPPPAPAPAPAPSPGGGGAAPEPTPAPAPPTPGRGIVPATIQAGLINGVPTAQVLDGYIRGGRTGTDWDAVVTALGRLPDDASVARAVGQAMPSMHGNAAQALLAHVSSTGSAVVGQQAGSGSDGAAAKSGTGLWVQPLNHRVDQDRYRQASGYRVRTQGLAGGYQASMVSGSTLGFGLAYLDGRVEGRDFAQAHRSDLESVQLLGYGSYDLSAWRLQWQADATRSSVKSARNLGFIGRSAKASYRGHASHLGLSMGRPMTVATTSVTPSVGLDWRRARSNAYTETGAGALDLRVAAQKAEELVAKLGVEARHPLGAQSHLLAQAAVGYDLSGGRDSTSAQFVGGGPVFSTPGSEQRRVLAELGLGLVHKAGDALEMRVHYDLSLRGKMTDQGVSLRLDWRF
ncbi:autotransporter outer membrane beta-barrel domain-containing protein [Hydrogenophaga flava]|uniref:autotransporter outer membrane beta-barrel domain-containing protein n=1 Tax=Hydrogenophaga flava TaxID=65657 RepID=UPI000AD057C0|nr:autotransporter outer membrane beta-barrel domain-containing protein [Hydrogenophaga flava]